MQYLVLLDLDLVLVGFVVVEVVLLIILLLLIHLKEQGVLMMDLV